MVIPRQVRPDVIGHDRAGVFHLDPVPRGPPPRAVGGHQHGVEEVVHRPVVHEVDVRVYHDRVRVDIVRVELHEFVRAAAPLLPHVRSEVVPPYLRGVHRRVPEEDLVPQIRKHVRAVRRQFGVHDRVQPVVVPGAAAGVPHGRPVDGVAQDRGRVEEAGRRGLPVGALYQGDGVRDRDRRHSFPSLPRQIILQPRIGIGRGDGFARNRRYDDDAKMQRQPEQ